MRTNIADLQGIDEFAEKRELLIPRGVFYFILRKYFHGSWFSSNHINLQEVFF